MVQVLVPLVQVLVPQVLVLWLAAVLQLQLILVPLLPGHQLWYHNGTLASGSVTVTVDCGTPIGNTRAPMLQCYKLWYHSGAGGSIVLGQIMVSL